MARLPSYYYCTDEEIDDFGLTEPGVPHDADISDPRILQKPTIFLAPGAAPVIDPLADPADDEGEEVASTANIPPPLPARGWTPERQSIFLAAVAEGHTVEAACRAAGLTVQSAYKLRRSAKGAAFAVGWNAAVLIQRNKLADALVSRVFDGQHVVTTRPDGSKTVRHFHDNRLAQAVLTRLDRLADEQVAEGTHHAARMIAQDFDSYLKVIEAGEGASARAGLFLARRSMLEVPEAHGEQGAAAAAALWSSPALAAIAQLARADLFARAGVALPAEIDTSDLAYADRASWTVDQWQRADAAGLLVSAQTPFGSSPSTACQGRRSGQAEVENPLRAEREASPSLGNGSRQARTQRGDWDDETREETSPHGTLQSPKPRPANSHGTGETNRVWYCPTECDLLTNFPPPEDFDGYENGRWGDPDYERTLSLDEQEIIDERERAQIQEVSGPDAAIRDQWFAVRIRGEGDVLGLYEAARDAAEADMEAPPPDAGAEDMDEDAALLAYMEEHDPLTIVGRTVAAGLEAVERGDMSSAMEALQKVKGPRPANRKARRTAASRKRRAA